MRFNLKRSKLPTGRCQSLKHTTCLEIKTLGKIFRFVFARLCVRPLHAQQGHILKISYVAFANVLHKKFDTGGLHSTLNIVTLTFGANWVLDFCRNRVISAFPALIR